MARRKSSGFNIFSSGGSRGGRKRSGGGVSLLGSGSSRKRKSSSGGVSLLGGIGSKHKRKSSSSGVSLLGSSGGNPTSKRKGKKTDGVNLLSTVTSSAKRRIARAQGVNILAKQPKKLNRRVDDPLNIYGKRKRYTIFGNTGTGDTDRLYYSLRGAGRRLRRNGPGWIMDDGHFNPAALLAVVTAISDGFLGMSASESTRLTITSELMEQTRWDKVSGSIHDTLGLARNTAKVFRDIIQAPFRFGSDFFSGEAFPVKERGDND